MFSKRKFLLLSHRKQHKYAGEYLRKLYDYKQPIDNTYRSIEICFNLLPISTQEDIEDRFHSHMKHAAIDLKEHHLLVKQYDKLSSVPYGTIYIYLEQLRSAFNIGNILRTTEAFRLGTTVFSHDTPNNTHPKVVKTAMGIAESIPCKSLSLEECPRPFIALETGYNACSLFSFAFPKTFTLLIGNEERGLREHTLLNSDYIVNIPLTGSKNSLNVASAFAIAAAEIHRQSLP